MFSLDIEPEGHLAIEAVVNGPIQTNTYYAISRGEAVIVDPAWDGEALARDFAAKHPDVRVAAIVCTHCHADHVGGVAGLRRALGDSAPYLISRADADGVGRALEHMRTSWGYETEDPGAPDRLLGEGDEIAFGDVRLQVISTPGHTLGGIALFCSSVEGPVAFVGDTLFPGSHGRTDLYGGDEGEIMASLAKLGRLLPPETLCLIGHGPETHISAELAGNPFMIEALRAH